MISTCMWQWDKGFADRGLTLESPSIDKKRAKEGERVVDDICGWANIQPFSQYSQSGLHAGTWRNTWRLRLLDGTAGNSPTDLRHQILNSEFLMCNNELCLAIDQFGMFTNACGEAGWSWSGRTHSERVCCRSHIFYMSTDICIRFHDSTRYWSKYI